MDQLRVPVVVWERPSIADVYFPWLFRPTILPLSYEFRRLTLNPGPETLECSVCIDDVPFETSVILLPCKHRFCADCLIKWGASQHVVENWHGCLTCPNCRSRDPYIEACGEPAWEALCKHPLPDWVLPSAERTTRLLDVVEPRVLQRHPALMSHLDEYGRETDMNYGKASFRRKHIWLGFAMWAVNSWEPGGPYHGVELPRRRKARFNFLDDVMDEYLLWLSNEIRAAVLVKMMGGRDYKRTPWKSWELRMRHYDWIRTHSHIDAKKDLRFRFCECGINISRDFMLQSSVAVHRAHGVVPETLIRIIKTVEKEIPGVSAQDICARLRPLADSTFEYWFLKIDRDYEPSDSESIVSGDSNHSSISGDTILSYESSDDNRSD